MTPRSSSCGYTSSLDRFGARVLARLSGARGMPTVLRMTAEMALLFGILLAIEHLLMPGRGFAEVEPHPYWIPVLAMAVCYGSGMGLAAAVVASALWFAAPHEVRGGDHLEAMLSLSVLPMLWIIVALAAGELTTSRRETGDQHERRIAELEDDNRELGLAVEHLAETNRCLQIRIVTEEHTVGQAIADALDLVNADPAHKLHGVERLVALAAQTEDFTFYAAQGHRFVTRFRGLVANRPDELHPDELAELVGSPLTRTQPGMLSLPVFAEDDEDSLVGLLVINDLPDSYLTASKIAELRHVAQSLSQLSGLLAPVMESLAPASWLLRGGRAA